MGKHSARGWVRNATAAVAAIAATVATFAVAQTSASATNWGADCQATAVRLQAPSPLILGQANAKYYPCDTDTKGVVSASATLIPAPLGIGATRLAVSGVSSKTFEGYSYLYDDYVTRASSDIAKVTITGPGLFVVVSGIHSDVTMFSDGWTVANTSIATLTVNGLAVKVSKNTPLVVPVGLRTAIYVDYSSAGWGGGYATPLAVTFPDHRYYLTVAESQVNECDCG